MICYVLICYVMLWYVMLCCVTFRFIKLWYVRYTCIIYWRIFLHFCFSLKATQLTGVSSLRISIMVTRCSDQFTILIGTWEYSDQEVLKLLGGQHRNKKLPSFWSDLFHNKRSASRTITIIYWKIEVHDKVTSCWQCEIRTVNGNINFLAKKMN